MGGSDLSYAFFSYLLQHRVSVLLILVDQLTKERAQEGRVGLWFYIENS